MLAVESVISSKFLVIPSATSETTTVKPSLTCATSHSVASCCWVKVPHIEAALPNSTAKSCSAVPMTLRLQNVVTSPRLSCVEAYCYPGACLAEDYVSLKGKLAIRSWTIQPAPRKVRPRCKLHSRLKAARFTNSHRHRLCSRHCRLPRVFAGFVVTWVFCWFRVSVCCFPCLRTVIPQHVGLAHDSRFRPRCKMRFVRVVSACEP